ncbi:hypothetical protein [Nonomuraea sp. NPDC046570]|uniref:Acg family FMN-binding oxidoreductase n=1 Tax=Nonomuraea sp. NPDC046570 TaxID=3155255 RepID=UPI0033EF7F9E
MILRAAVRAATWAPSLHNTQPWSFAIEGEEVSVRCDRDRQLRAADEEGRQLLVSCGAALFNLRLSLRAAGVEPVTRLSPDPDRPALLATVRVGPPVEADEVVRRMHAEIERRRTHRAGFADLSVPDELIDGLVREAAGEAATLTPVRDPAAVAALAALTEAAQFVQGQDQKLSLELIRWARPPGSTRGDGVPAEAYPRAPASAFSSFAQRDYSGTHDWGRDSAETASGTSTGLVALVTTTGDSRTDWVAAGQALQAVLLHASAYGLSAAFHTQALENPHLRAFLREEFCSDTYPQMIMRLGFTSEENIAVRRDLSEVLEGTDDG